MEGRLASPPALPRIRPVPRSGTTAEHVATHDGGADVDELPLEHRCALVDLAARLAMCAPPRLERDHPLMESLATDAEGFLEGLIRTGHEAVQREGDSQSKL